MNGLPTVLYAEDDENDAFFMTRAFTKLKCKDALHIVSNGKVAIDYLAGNESYADREKHPLPEIVFLDVKMPLLSGLETVAWIRARREFDPLTVVMFTSSTQQSDVDISRKHGANGYLVKPSNADDLSKVVQSVVTARASMPPGSSRLAIEGNAL